MYRYFVIDLPRYHPAKPSYSHCVKLGRSDCHFSTAARVKKTVTPPTDKTVTVLVSQLARSGDHRRARPAKTWRSVCQGLAMSSGYLGIDCR